MGLTDHDVAEAMKRLGTQYPIRRTDDPKLTRREWLFTLGDMTRDELHHAVTEYMRTPETFAPTAGQLRTMVIARRGRNEYQRPAEKPCDVCGAEPGQPHDSTKHRKAFSEVWDALRKSDPTTKEAGR